MQLIENISRLLSRFRYPVSLPMDVASDLGLFLPNTLPFQEFIRLLTSPHSLPTTLKKGMPRYKAESVFKLAIRKEIFKSSSLFSYKFNQGWVTVALYFNDHDLLTRLFLQSPYAEIDLPLEQEVVSISSLHAFGKKI